MIAKSPAPEVGLGYQAQALQQLQGAIDSGDVHLGIFGANLGVDILSAYMVIALLKGGEDELALRGQSVTQLPKSFAYLFRPLQSLHRIL